MTLSYSNSVLGTKDEINQFESIRFQECDSLRRIPGMVGILSEKDSSSSYAVIGLSDLQADQDGNYVFDQKEVSPNQPSEVLVS